MRRVFKCVTVLLLVAGLALSGCSSAPGGGKCKWGVCIDLELAEPIGWNEPVTVTITVETEEDIQGLRVRLWFSDPDVLVEGEREWVVDAKAHTPMQFSTTIRFTEEGYYSVHAGAQDFVGELLVQDAKDVRITTLGGTLNPPSEQELGTPELLEETLEPTYLMPSSPLPTPPSPLPTPRDSSQPDALLEERVAATISSGVPPDQDQGGWEYITSEGFEYPFPSTGWTVQDSSNDGYERYWDDDNYRPHNDYWAAWPANGGADGIDPALGDHDYPDNIDTRMIYGPFDLSDAVVLAIQFWLWREVEADYDYLTLEISHDGIAFQELARWNDDNKDWEQQQIYCYECGGDDSVWVAWRFYSDSSITRDGPWIDDIAIWKYVPGQVTAHGSFHYYDRDDNQVPARYTRVYLYDADSSGGDDLLGSTTTEADGSWEIGPLSNWDEDDPGFLDLYAVFETDVEDSAAAHRQATNFDSWAYKWQIPTQDNVADGTVDLGGWSIGNGSNWEAAMWIFQDLWRGWEYVQSNTGTDPGSATVRWENGETLRFPCTGSCFWPFSLVNGIFIGDPHQNSPDTVIHELGHQYMYNALGWWYWTPDTWDDLATCLSHGMFSQETPLCAWTEGWADFLPLVVNGDSCYDFGQGPCTGIPDVDYYDLEAHARGDGWEEGILSKGGCWQITQTDWHCGVSIDAQDFVDINPPRRAGWAPAT